MYHIVTVFLLTTSEKNMNFSPAIYFWTFKNRCILLFTLFLFSTAQGQAQPNSEVKIALDSMLLLVKEKSLYSAKVNWNKVQQKL